MPPDTLELHSNHLLTIPLLGAFLLFSLGLALLILSLVRRVVRTPELQLYAARLGAITFTVAVAYFPISLGCVLLNQWCSGQLFQHNLTLYSKDETHLGNLALTTQYTVQGDVDAYVERSYGYERRGSNSWGSPIYLDHAGNQHVNCSMSYGDRVKVHGVSGVRINSFDCP